MNVKKQLKNYKEMETIIPNEEKINSVIIKSKEAFYLGQKQNIMSYHEFLWNQLRFIQKRWWGLQFLLLIGIWGFMTLTEEPIRIRKMLGVCSVLFVILIIPELWKNRTYHSMEIESSSYYSLRQIYAARMMMFAIVDVILISIFCCVTSNAFQLSIMDLMVQWFLPMSVTACICFQVLCSKWHLNEVVAIGFCIIWSGVWIIVLLDKTIYLSITLPIWMIMLSISLAYLCVVVYRMLKQCDKFLEEVPIWS